MQSYSWNCMGTVSSSQADDAVPADVEVSRFALSFLLVPVSIGADPRLTIVNPHPDSWNTFMFPYGGIRVDDPTPPGYTSLGDLSSRLDELVRTRREDYLVSAGRELGSLFAGVPDLRTLVPVYRNYSLKFSASAKVWTAYVFTYHPVMADALGKASVAVKQLDLAEVAGWPEAPDQELEENVVAFLGAPLARLWATA